MWIYERVNKRMGWTYAFFEREWDGSASLRLLKFLNRERTVSQNQKTWWYCPKSHSIRSWRRIVHEFSSFFSLSLLLLFFLSLSPSSLLKYEKSSFRLTHTYTPQPAHNHQNTVVPLLSRKFPAIYVNTTKVYDPTAHHRISLDDRYLSKIAFSTPQKTNWEIFPNLQNQRTSNSNS